MQRIIGIMIFARAVKERCMVLARKTKCSKCDYVYQFEPFVFDIHCLICGCALCVNCSYTLLEKKDGRDVRVGRICKDHVGVVE